MSRQPGLFFIEVKEMSLFVDQGFIYVEPRVGIKDKTKYPLAYDTVHDLYFLSCVLVINGKYTSTPYICKDKNGLPVVFSRSAFDKIDDVDDVGFINLCAKFYDGLNPEDIDYFGGEE